MEDKGQEELSQIYTASSNRVLLVYQGKMNVIQTPTSGDARS